MTAIRENEGFLLHIFHALPKLSCDERFTHAFTAFGCVFKETTLVGLNQSNYFENASACSKRTLKTTVATQLNCTTKSRPLYVFTSNLSATTTIRIPKLWPLLNSNRNLEVSSCYKQEKPDPKILFYYRQAVAI